MKTKMEMTLLQTHPVNRKQFPFLPFFTRHLRRDTSLNGAFLHRRGVLEVCHGICVPIPCAVCVGVEVIVPGGDGTKAGPDFIRTIDYRLVWLFGGCGRLGWGHEHLAFSAGI